MNRTLNAVFSALGLTIALMGGPVILPMWAVPEAIAQTRPQDFLTEGVQKLEAEDYEGAIADLTRAIELDPKFADAYTARGIARHRSEDYVGAVEDFTEVLEIQPENSQVYGLRALDYLYLQEYQAAIADFNRVIEENPQD
ncbi:MAG TPA: tetratricopeptide repeat protein, partial [Vampirovibrionales bacterium]